MTEKRNITKEDIFLKARILSEGIRIKVKKLERISKGVYSAPLVVVPARGSPYEQFRPPTADWFIEANEKIADSYFRYADTLDVNLLTDNRPGFTRIGLSYSHILIRDEMVRRLQEQGKFPPGLPSQDFIE